MSITLSQGVVNSMKVASKHLPSAITISATGPEPAETVIKTTKQLYDWADKELPWRREISAAFNTFRPTFMNRHSVNIKKNTQLINEIQSKIENKHHLDEIIIYVQENITPSIQSEEIITHDDRRILKIQNLIHHDMNASWIILLDLFSIKYQLNDVTNFPQFIDSQINAKSSIQSIKIEARSYKSQLLYIKNKFEEDLHSLNQKYEDQITENEHSNKKSIRIQRKILTKQRNISKSSEQLSTETISKCETDLNQFKEAYSTEMKLRAGEALWRHKKRQHRKAKNGWFLSSAVWISIGILILSTYYTKAVSIYINDESLRSLEIPISLQAIVFLAPAIIYVWVAKIFLSNYRNNQSQEEDAEERQTMVMTYKALEYDGKRTSNEERALILNALFRSRRHEPDDALPSPIWETVLNRLSKNS
tara:strand:+ start:1114 stop:2376 length:1263 start_codon:yes stop_codon:yes gene_type:complete